MILIDPKKIETNSYNLTNINQTEKLITHVENIYSFRYYTETDMRRKTCKIAFLSLFKLVKLLLPCR